MATVELKDVQKRFGMTQVIHGVDLEIADGEFIVVVGPSGCGKSTLLRMVAGLETISGGEVSIDGTVVNKLEPMDRNIAMVFQNYALYPHMSVFNNMAYGLRNRRVPTADIDEKVREAADILELGGLLERKPSQLSGGQRQRVAMGRAIVRNPKVFLFDEPLSNLDAKLRVNMRLEIRKLQRRLGITTIYVTHDQVEAMTMADRLVVMNAGRAEQIGTPRDVYRKPATKFVAGFIGSPAMNFVTADLNGADGNLRTLGVELPPPNGVSVAGVDTVELGIRPEHIKIEPETGPIHLQVEAVENLGVDTIIYGRSPAHEADPIAVRIEGDRSFALDEEVRVAIDPTAMHLFDQSTGRRLS
ncbi:MAG: sn-glycerol-3-phosphate import ATP-binding protein UgpC [Hyphomicrobiaceae bacterium]